MSRLPPDVSRAHFYCASSFFVDLVKSSLPIFAPPLIWSPKTSFVVSCSACTFACSEQSRHTREPTLEQTLLHLLPVHALPTLPTDANTLNYTVLARRRTRKSGSLFQNPQACPSVPSPLSIQVSALSSLTLASGIFISPHTDLEC